MSICKRCGGTSVLPAQFLGETPKPCPECNGTGYTNGAQEWVWLGWQKQDAPPQVVIECRDNRHLSLAEAKQVAAKLVAVAAWGERVWARLKEKGDEGS